MVVAAYDLAVVAAYGLAVAAAYGLVVAVAYGLVVAVPAVCEVVEALAVCHAVLLVPMGLPFVLVPA